MRPRKVVLEGFSAYRKRTEVPFTDVDFFSISGPTGSGKSSLIDAMVFALYGRVPRLGGNAVAPAISAGSDWARVMLEFETGAKTYQVVRRAQRTVSGGASVKEARLESGDEVLANGAEDVTAAVEDLLHLRFDDFTRTVVLPQGEFAQFLKATKSERQGLLRNLLGFELYRTVRSLAETRRTVAVTKIEAATNSLATLDVADGDQVATWSDRVDRLESLAITLAKAELEITDLEKESLETSSALDKANDRIDRLSQIKAPKDLDQLDMKHAETVEEQTTAHEKLETLQLALRSLNEERSSLPDQTQLQAWAELMESRALLSNRLGEDELVAAAANLKLAEESLDAAQQTLQSKTVELESMQTTHAAHLVTATLSPGDICPVCDNPVTAIPDRPGPSGLGDLTSDVETCRVTVATATEAVSAARTDVARLESVQGEILAQIERLDTQLAETPSVERLGVMADRHATLAEAITASEKEIESQQARVKALERELEALAQASRSVDKELKATLIKVGDLDPPISESDDAIVQWKELLVWRDLTTPAITDHIRDLEEVKATLESDLKKANASVRESLTAESIDVSPPFAVAIAKETEAVRSLISRNRENEEHAVRLGAEIDESSAHAAVAAELVKHLRADRFEQWLMAGALGDLVAGANELLGQLSGGEYSLDSDETGDFSVIDHANANETRAVATLSGGETFVVSLALALSLAETLSARGEAGLDAIILDEGFGTLDDETLEVVASVLEELTSRGLMVGVITHVKELAARAPVRYEVSSTPTGSAVEVYT